MIHNYPLLKLRYDIRTVAVKLPVNQSMLLVLEPPGLQYFTGSMSIPLHSNLPLSWRIIPSDCPVRIERSPLDSNYEYVAFADIPANSVSDTLSIIKRTGAMNYLFRGASAQFIAQNQRQLTWSMQTGVAAVIELRNFAPKRSLKELARAGQRRLELTSLPQQPSAPLYEKLFNNSLRSRTPRLRKVFRTGITPVDHTFVVSSSITQQPQGLVTFSKLTDGYFHLETILRSKDAPRGTMEFLMLSAFEILAESSNQSVINLGEVPFIATRSPLKGLYKAYTLLIERHYSVRGLFDFKNKFLPDWQPVYAAGTRRPNFRQAYQLMRCTNTLAVLHPHLNYWIDTLTTKKTIGRNVSTA
ncbi:MAG: DUF2156 domain-containing protein [Bdellovibrionales bacterium]|nr:DUF2156 domain-containing protein [Bdellovibrionales bacterium]